MSLTPIPEQHLPYSFVGPASIPLRQHINNGMTTAYMGMPFKPDTMTQGSEFSRARRIYSRVDRFKKKTSVEDQQAGIVRSDNFTKKSKVIQALPVQKHFTSSEERIAMRKMEAIGKSSMKQGMSRTAPLSFRSQERNSRNTALSKVRGGGAVAPKKKGAIANSFKSG